MPTPHREQDPPDDPWTTMSFDRNGATTITLVAAPKNTTGSNATLNALTAAEFTQDMKLIVPRGNVFVSSDTARRLALDEEQLTFYGSMHGSVVQQLYGSPIGATIDLVNSNNVNIGFTFPEVTFDQNDDGLTGTAHDQIIAIEKIQNGTPGDQMPDDPTRNEEHGITYEFAGWNTAPDGSGESFTATTTVPYDMTVYATWTAKKPVEARKIWADTPEEFITPDVFFQLYRTSVVEEIVQDALVAVDENGIADFCLQPIADTEGQLYEYFVREVDSNGDDFVPTDFEKLEDGLTVTNTYIEPVVDPEDPPTPIDPTDPEEPSTPTEPTRPVIPVTPDEPSATVIEPTAQTPSETKEASPRTSDTNTPLGSIAIIGIASALIGLGLLRSARYKVGE